jgi:hypothetical protein
MQVHNFSEIKSIEGQISLQDQLQGIIKYGFSWPKDLKAQDIFTAKLQKEIDQRSTLIRDFNLPDIEVAVPFILIGPPGIRVILPTRERGMFRAREGQWLIHTGKGFKPSKENLIRKTQLYMLALRKFLDEHGFQSLQIDGLVVGLDPGLHVETHNSAVRVIQSDAIRRFCSQWEQEQPKISPEQIYQVVLAITQSATIDQIADNKDVRAALVEPKEDKFQKSLEPLQKKFAFSPKQWIIVGILIAATVFVLFVFMLIVILSL